MLMFAQAVQEPQDQMRRGAPDVCKVRLRSRPGIFSRVGRRCPLPGRDTAHARVHLTNTSRLSLPTAVRRPARHAIIASASTGMAAVARSPSPGPSTLARMSPRPPCPQRASSWSTSSRRPAAHRAGSWSLWAHPRPPRGPSRSRLPQLLRPRTHRLTAYWTNQPPISASSWTPRWRLPQM
jgi:hypothetical protein